MTTTWLKSTPMPTVACGRQAGASATRAPIAEGAQEARPGKVPHAVPKAVPHRDKGVDEQRQRPERAGGGEPDVAARLSWTVPAMRRRGDACGRWAMRASIAIEKSIE